MEQTKTLIYAAHVASQAEGQSGMYPNGDIATTYATPVSFKITHQPITNALLRLSYGLLSNSMSRLVFATGDNIPFEFAEDKTDVLWIGVIPNGTLVDSSAMNHTHTIDSILRTGNQTVVTIKRRGGV